MKKLKLTMPFEEWYEKHYLEFASKCDMESITGNLSDDIDEMFQVMVIMENNLLPKLPSKHFYNHTYGGDYSHTYIEIKSISNSFSNTISMYSIKNNHYECIFKCLDDIDSCNVNNLFDDLLNQMLEYYKKQGLI